MSAAAIIALIEALITAEPAIGDSVEKLIAAIGTSDPDTLGAMLAQANADADAQHGAAQG